MSTGFFLEPKAMHVLRLISAIPLAGFLGLFLSTHANAQSPGDLVRLQREQRARDRLLISLPR